MDSKTINDKEKVNIDILFKECETIGQQINYLFGGGERIIALGLVILGAGLTYGLKERINEILLILPIAVYGVMIYGAHIFTELTSLGGYKKYLEERINKSLGENILLWELYISKQRHGSFGRIALFIIYTMFLVLTIYFSFTTALKLNCKAIFWGNIIIIVFLGICLLISFREMNSAFENIYNLSKEQGKKDILISEDTSSNIPRAAKNQRQE